MTTKYSPLDEEVKAAQPYTIDVPGANLLPLALMMLQRLRDSDYDMSDDTIESFSVEGVFYQDYGSLLVLAVIDDDEEEEEAGT